MENEYISLQNNPPPLVGPSPTHLNLPKFLYPPTKKNTEQNKQYNEINIEGKERNMKLNIMQKKGVDKENKYQLFPSCII